MTSTTSSELKFAREQHITYIATLDEKEKESFEFHVTEHLRMSGIYWGITAIDILKQVNKMKQEQIIQFVLKCQHTNGGFGGNLNHDAHLLYTLSAVQILAVLGSVDKIDKERTANYVASLQQEDGSFIGDKWGEVDTRFSYIALNCLSLLGYSGKKLSSKINLEKAVQFVLNCQNFDGGFGAVPGAESHAGQIFCCVGALAIADALDKIDIDTLAWWLCERQTADGGLNGRPEKKSDVCYSWWVLSSLAMMDRLHWINKENLRKFIMRCQDEENGGISDKPGNMVDVYHTFFGIAGLSLLQAEPDLKPVDPMYALPVDALVRCGITTRYTKKYCN